MAKQSINAIFTEQKKTINNQLAVNKTIIALIATN